MRLTSLHLMLTYLCTLECEHCFAWGSPWQSGTMTGADVDHILDQAQKLGTIESIYFEGGEAFLNMLPSYTGCARRLKKVLQLALSRMRIGRQACRMRWPGCGRSLAC